MISQFSDQTQLELVRDIFKNEISDSQLSIKRFRVAYSDYFDDIDYLENNNYIAKNGNYYRTKLESISLIAELEPKAQQYIEKAQQLFLLLQTEYRNDPDVSLSLSSLKDKLGYSRNEINQLVGYLVDLPIFSGRTTELKAEDAYVAPSESILKYASLNELLEVVKGWRKKPPTMVANLEEIIRETTKVEDFSFLLHPGITKTSLRLYQDGHLREAVLNSMTAVFDFIRQKTGLVDDDGDRLIGKVFSLEDPYLILNEIDTESGRSDQKGFMQIFRGAYQGIRNPKAHTLEHDLTELKAAQYLVFASLMMRRIDEASMVKID